MQEDANGNEHWGSERSYDWRSGCRSDISELCAQSAFGPAHHAAPMGKGVRPSHDADGGTLPAGAEMSADLFNAIAAVCVLAYAVCEAALRLGIGL